MTALLVILALWVLAAGGVVLIVGRLARRRDRHRPRSHHPTP